jgi:hypothetical protein
MPATVGMDFLKYRRIRMADALQSLIQKSKGFAHSAEIG